MSEAANLAFQWIFVLNQVLPCEYRYECCNHEISKYRLWQLVKYPIQLNEIIKTDMFLEKFLWHSWQKFIFALAVYMCNMLLKSQNYLRGFCNQFKKLFWKLFKTISLENNSDYPLQLIKPSPNGNAASDKWRIFLCRISSITWRNIYKLYKWFAQYFAKIKRYHILNDLWARATDNWKIILRLPWMLFL